MSKAATADELSSFLFPRRLGIREQYQQLTEKETPNASNSGAREALFHGGFWSFKPSVSFLSFFAFLAASLLHKG
jgi:hypothetical protein